MGWNHAIVVILATSYVVTGMVMTWIMREDLLLQKFRERGKIWGIFGLVIASTYLIVAMPVIMLSFIILEKFHGRTPFFVQIGIMVLIVFGTFFLGVALWEGGARRLQDLWHVPIVTIGLICVHCSSEKIARCYNLPKSGESMITFGTVLLLAMCTAFFTTWNVYIWALTFVFIGMAVWEVLSLRKKERKEQSRKSDETQRYRKLNNEQL